MNRKSPGYYKPYQNRPEPAPLAVGPTLSESELDVVAADLYDRIQKTKFEEVV